MNCPETNVESKEVATAQKVFVRIAEDEKSTCSKRRPRFSRDQLNPMSQGDCPVSSSQGLDFTREESSIPIANGAVLPGHQDEDQKNWVYPSEKQFYDAMKRKGWQPNEKDMRNVVGIHNAVNERAWKEITHWERSLHPSCNCPRLRSFQGKPQQYSPKARLLNFLGYKLPFDRHDWIVDRCGKEVRYVIDFYNAAPKASMPIAMHLDVRPALDSFGALWDRLKMQGSWISSGRWRNV